MKQNQLSSEPLIIITGAAGLIGSGVVRYLNDQGKTNLFLVDELGTQDKWKNLVGKHFVDLVSPYDLFDFLDGSEDQVSAFIHLGACSDTTEKDADYLLDNNYRFSIRLAEYAIQHKKRFIYASSAATYGNGSLGFSDDHELLEQLHPLNMYGYSKHLFDLWLKREGLLDQVVGLKYFNIFGPNENHKEHMQSVIPKMVPKIQTEGVIELFKSNTEEYKDGEQYRDFLYVKDAVKMTCQFLKNTKANGLFNIGMGKPTTWNQIAEYLFKAMEKDLKIRYIDIPSPLNEQYQNYTCADMEKFQKLQKNDQDFFTPLEEAIKDYVQNYILVDKRW